MRKIPVVSLRMVREGTVAYMNKRLDSAQKTYELFRPMLEELDRESVWVACLNTKKELCCLSQVSVGSLKSVELHPREVFKIALASNSDSIITVHNHPSGDPSPSMEDINVTDRLHRAGLLLGIELLDHLIVGRGKYFSFADEGSFRERGGLFDRSDIAP